MSRELLIATAFVAGLSSVAAVAQNNVIAERQQLMKQNLQANRTMTNMLKGTEPFDLAKVQATLKGFATDYHKLPGLFPPGSEAGGETRALPKIWAEKAKFDQVNADFEKAVSVASAAIKDEASFKVEFPKVVANCDTCHDAYRAPRR